jgi:hypothetical protein
MLPADAPLDLTRARQLASAGEAVHIPHDLARTIAAELGRACDEVERARAAEVVLRRGMADAWESARGLNRRAQKAEAIADRCVPGRPQTGPGLGRALANYAAARLADLAREAVEGWAAAARCEGACQHGHECAPSAELAARLDALTGEGRATLPAMATLPTLERLGYAYYLRRRAPDAPTWDRLTAAQRDAELSAVRWVCDTALGADGAGVVYAVSPGDPPPTSPSP